MSRAKMISSLVAVLLSQWPSLGSAGEPSPRRYAIVIANNYSLDSGVTPLAYADDDGAKYYELFAALNAQVRFLAVLDPDAQKRFVEAANASVPPTRKALDTALAEVFAAIKEDNDKGLSTVFYFVYTGHGHTGSNQEGYVNLQDERFSRTQLFADVIAKSPATWNHIILDACYAYFMVQKRGTKSDKIEGATPALQRFLKTEELQRYPNTGVILASSAQSETHEWSRWQAGIFSHELRSALLGAGDVDGDGLVTYSEAAAAVEAANVGILDPTARLRVFARPPSARIDLPLIDLKDLSKAAQLRIDSTLGHIYVEDSRGVRVADLNPTAESKPMLALVGQPPFFLRDSLREARVPMRSRGGPPVAASKLRFVPASHRSRGSLEETFRNQLFEQPFGRSFYRGITATWGPGGQTDGWYGSAADPEPEPERILAAAASGSSPSATSRPLSEHPSPNHSRLRVASAPSAARVFVDGREAGVSPLVLDEQTVGTHAVRLELSGCAPAETQVELEAGKSVSVDFGLSSVAAEQERTASHHSKATAAAISGGAAVLLGSGAALALAFRGDPNKLRRDVDNSLAGSSEYKAARAKVQQYNELLIAGYSLAAVSVLALAFCGFELLSMPSDAPKPAITITATPLFGGGVAAMAHWALP